MLLLAVDTSGKPGSIALSTGNSDGTCVPIEGVLLEGGAFSAQLVPEIARLLLKNGFTRLDISGFVAVSGPGSFTGLRVGLAAIKALAEVLKKPIAEISMLDAIAAAGDIQQKTIVGLSAGKDRIFIGEYEGRAAPRNETLRGATETMQGVAKKDRLVSCKEFLALVSGSKVLTPNAEVADQARGVAASVRTIEMPGADSIAKLGWTRILSHHTVSPEALDANYTGRGDSEIFSGTQSRL